MLYCLSVLSESGSFSLFFFDLYLISSDGSSSGETEDQPSQEKQIMLITGDKKKIT